MRIVFMGRSERAAACLRSLDESKHEVVLVVAQTGEDGWFRSIACDAAASGLACVECDSPDALLYELLTELQPDLAVLCCYNALIRKPLREIPKHGFINLHAGAVPRYRGDAPLNWAVINGETTVGLSVLRVDAGVDTGDILAQETIEIRHDEYIGEIVERTLEIYPRMLVQVCDRLDATGIEGLKQDPLQGETYTHRGPMDGRIDWEGMTDVGAFNMVRALAEPYPGAFFYHDGLIKVWRASLESQTYKGVPGRIATFKGDSMIVICKNRGLGLDVVEKAGSGQKVPARELFKETAVDLQ